MGFPSRIVRRCLLVLLFLLPTAGWASTPGEARNLTVTGYDPATGKLSLSYEAACGAANHHIEYGPLQEVKTYGYSGQLCSIGTSGLYDQFNPGPGSYFFLLVGDDGVSVEGSYGSSFINGVLSERPEDTLDPTCSFVRDLSQSCDVVRIDVAESIGVSDAPVVLPPVVINLSEAIGVADGVQVLPPVVITVAETIGVADAPAPQPSVFVSVAEAIGVSDAPVVRPPVVINVAEPIGVADAPAPQPSLFVSVAEHIGVSDAPVVRPPALVNVTEAIGVADGVQVLPPVVINVAEQIGVADAPAPQPSLFVSVAEHIGVSDAPAVYPPVQVNVTEAIGVADGVQILLPVVIHVAETIGVADAASVQPAVFISLAEAINVADAPAVHPPVLINVTEAIGVADGVQVLLPVVIQVAETIGVADAPAVEPAVFISLAEAIKVSDAPAANPPALVNVTEAIGVADGHEVRPPALIAVNEMIGVADTPTGDGMQSLAHSGAAVSAAGDLNGDGIGDWLVGAPSHRAMGRPVEAGTVTVHFGSADPAERMKADLIFEGAGAHDRAGVAVAGNFDFNGDGRPDILIGAEQFNRTSDHDPNAGCDAGAPCGAGKVYLIYFDPGNPVFSSSPLSLADVGTAIPGVVFEGAAPGDRAGFSIAAGGRINSGAGQDILIGTPGRDTPGGPDSGSVYAIFDAPSLSGTVSLARIACTRGAVPCPAADEIAGVVFEGAAAGDSLGFSTAFMGDVVRNTGAGLATAGADIAMGAPGADSGGDDSGTLYVADTGRAGIDTSRVEVSRIGSTAPGIQMRGTQTGEQLGWAISAGGDSRSDGLPDMLLGAPFYNAGGSVDAGRVLQTSAVFTTGIVSADAVGGSIGGVTWLGAAPHDNLGRALAGVGDVTGDGLDDVALGAPLTDPVVDARVIGEAGSVYLIEGLAASGGAGRVPVSEVGLSVPGEELVGNEAGEHVGSSIAVTSDIDGDGDDDFIVGAPDRDLSADEPDAGGVYLVLESAPAQVSRLGPGVWRSS